jgi:hypothetical protein
MPKKPNLAAAVQYTQKGGTCLGRSTEDGKQFSFLVNGTDFVDLTEIGYLCHTEVIQKLFRTFILMWY